MSIEHATDFDDTARFRRELFLRSPTRHLVRAAGFFYRLVRPRMLPRLALCAVAALLLSGCWPTRVTYQPGITGTVISADDGKPVVGASIEMIVPREDLVPVSAIATNSEGRFEVKPYYRWGMAFFLAENWPGQGTVEIAASGFAPHTQEVSWRGPRTQEIGVIQLVPLR